MDQNTLYNGQMVNPRLQNSQDQPVTKPDPPLNVVLTLLDGLKIMITVIEYTRDAEGIQQTEQLPKDPLI